MSVVRSILLTIALAVGCGGGAAPLDGSVPPGTDAARPDAQRMVPPPPPPPVGTTLTTIVVENTSDQALTNVPVTFASPFRAGDVPAGDFVVARDQGEGVATQLDAKATHADGSLRHAVITVVLAALGPRERRPLDLVASTTPGSSGAALTGDALMANGFSAEVAFGGASARFVPGTETWLRGPLATELSSVADVTVDGRPLSVRFDVRWYGGATARIGVTVENDWAFEPGPRNATYDATVNVGGAQAFAANGLTHYAWSRWHRVAWWGDPIPVHVSHDASYVIATGAVAAYDTSLEIGEGEIASLRSDWDGHETGPMAVGLPEAYMPTTGGRRDIGPLPSWDVQYLLTGDARLWPVVEGSADLAGSWPIHYRERATGRPPTLDDHPNMTLLGDPAAAGPDAFPDCAGDCDTPLSPDSAHQPSLGYLAYLLGGDPAHLDELHFWANWNMLQANFEYRDHASGLLHWDQVRGQAWSLRTLGYAAWVTPDAHPLKDYFEEKLANNLRDYTERYAMGANANALGLLEAHAFLVDDTIVSEWQDDFFTWTVGQLLSMGYEDARVLLEYKARFVVGRMTDPSSCWILAAMYEVKARDTPDSPTYSTFAELYRVNAPASVQGLTCASDAMASALDLRPGEMDGYADSAEGYPSNMQPALASAAEHAMDGAVDAWAVFAARPIQPDYAPEPQFAVVPTRPR